jgi:predicted transcriptional regulator
MARKKSTTLTDSEMRLMRIVWKIEPCTVGDVVDQLPEGEELAYSTVLTTMRILEEKGYLGHVKDGRAYVYNAIVPEGQVRKHALKHVMNKYFNDSPELLLANIFGRDDVSGDDLEAIRNLLDSLDTGATPNKNEKGGTQS